MKTIPPPSAPPACLPSCICHIPIRTRHLVIAAACLFAALVAGKFHGLSIGCWDDPSLMPPAPEEYRYRELGSPRWDRADDWNVSVPQIMAQCAAPEFFPRVNPRVDLGRDMFASTPSNPVWDVTAPAQPHNWGFFLFGAERGFAWSWWLRFLGLPLAAFLALRPRLGGDALLAATGAAAVSLGAPTQWWDTSLPYLLLYGFASLVFLDAIGSARSPVFRTASALALACSVSAFFLAGYPPFAVLLFPVFLLLALPCGGGRQPALRRFALALALCGAVALLVAAIALHADTLRLIATSAYPGSRSFAGGTPAKFLRHVGLALLSPVFPFEALRPAFAPFAASNPCNAARWYAPALALVVALCLRGPGRPSICDRLLPVFAAVLALWALLPWPAGLARAVGLSRIDPRRAEVVLGLVLLLSGLRLLARRRSAGASAPRMLAVAVALVSAAAAVAAIMLPGGQSVFRSRLVALAVAAGAAVVAGAAAWGLLSSCRASFCAAVLAVSLPGLAVHPFARGLAPMRDKPFAALARSIDAAEPGRWLANTATTGNFLMAQGLDCIAGTQAYAVPAVWGVLDPENRLRPAWNRYAHTIVELGPDGGLDASAPSADHLRYRLSEAQLRALGIRHLVWSGKKLHEPWLRYDGRIRLHFFYTLPPR